MTTTRAAMVEAVHRALDAHKAGAFEGNMWEPDLTAALTAAAEALEAEAYSPADLQAHFDQGVSCGFQRAAKHLDKVADDLMAEKRRLEADGDKHALHHVPAKRLRKHAEELRAMAILPPPEAG